MVRVPSECNTSIGNFTVLPEDRTTRLLISDSFHFENECPAGRRSVDRARVRI
jgi:hypothetical protein